MERMHQRKVPLFIHVEPMIPVILGYTCRYCPDCDLLVAHQDELEDILGRALSRMAPGAVGNDYLVIGTVERDYWRQGMKTPQSVADLPGHLHDFIAVWTLEVSPGGWYPDEVIEAREREIAQARAEFAARKAQAEADRSRPAVPTACPARQRKKQKKKR